MIAHGSLIVIDGEGGTRRVENLKIGDAVLNPLGRFLDQITAIEKHSVRVAGASLFQQGLVPRLLRKHCISKVAPACDTILSADQVISVALKEPGAVYPVITQLRVDALEEHMIEAETFKQAEVEYYAISLQTGNQIVVNNLLCNVARLKSEPVEQINLRVARS